MDLDFVNFQNDYHILNEIIDEIINDRTLPAGAEDFQSSQLTFGSLDELGFFSDCMNLGNFTDSNAKISKQERLLEQSKDFARLIIMTVLHDLKLISKNGYSLANNSKSKFSSPKPQLNGNSPNPTNSFQRDSNDSDFTNRKSDFPQKTMIPNITNQDKQQSIDSMSDSHHIEYRLREFKQKYFTDLDNSYMKDLPIINDSQLKQASKSIYGSFTNKNSLEKSNLQNRKININGHPTEKLNLQNIR